MGGLDWSRGNIRSKDAINVPHRKPIPVDEFLAWEERQALRYEFDGVRPLARTGGTAAHAAIQHNLNPAVTGRLRDSPCQPYGSEPG